MQIEETTIEGCYVISPQLHVDERGWFARFFCEEEFVKAGLSKKIVQINHSFNLLKGTFRGMHYQVHPYAETKLIRCITGAVNDYVLDLRRNSPTFLNHIKIELSAENKKLILVPEGMAHGFQTIENNSELIYHHTQFYKKEAERGIRYNDPKINIQLDFPISSISERDKNYSLITDNYTGIEI